jgi:site-specific DNA-methyltransferase (adenine-specific)
MSKFTLYNDDCLNAMKTMEDNSIDSCVTDPPYGLSFMGKAWDYDVPKAEIWKEVFRVLKPGGHVLAFFGSRTYHRGVVQIEEAGFEIRDQIMWLYGSGFPKSHNIGDGWGTALKPAHEPIVVARKPITQTVAKNVLEHGTGALNIDGCRVGHVTVDGGSLATNPHLRGKIRGGNGGNIFPTETESRIVDVSPLGRWPANVMHDGSDEVVSGFPNTSSGMPGIRRKEHATNSMAGRLNVTGEIETGYGDSGSAARFFYCAKASKSDKDEGLEKFLAKKVVSFQTGGGASGKPSSLSAGRDTEYKNIHPTVKPTELMKYLCRLVTPKDGIVLDPFMGSGSTGKAAAQEGFRFVGIEMSKDYFEIAEARIEHAYQGKIVNLEEFFS